MVLGNKLARGSCNELESCNFLSEKKLLCLLFRWGVRQLFRLYQARFSCVEMPCRRLKDVANGVVLLDYLYFPDSIKPVGDENHGK